MYKLAQTRFRKDLIVTHTTDPETLTKYYWVKDPATGEAFEFGEEEYFLCQSMDGTSTSSQILAAFKSRFDLSMTESDFQEFAKQIASFGLLETCQEQNSATEALSSETELPSPYLQMLETYREENELPPPLPKRQKKPKEKQKAYLWVLKEPERVFVFLAERAKPFVIVIKIILLGLIPGLPLAIFTFFNNQHSFWQDMHFVTGGGIGFILHFLLNITLLNFFGKILQSIVFTAFGGKVKTFGLSTTLRFHPRFYIDRSWMYQLPDRRGKFWTFITPILFRLSVFVLSMLTWQFSWGTGTTLRIWALNFAHSTFFEFMFECTPILPNDGYYLVATVFNLPSDFRRRAKRVFGMMLKRQPIPNLSTKEKLFLATLSLVSTVFTVTFCIVIVRLWSNGLAEAFSGIFGRGTQWIVFLILATLAFHKPIIKKIKSFYSSLIIVPSDPLDVVDIPVSTEKRSKPVNSHKLRSKKWIKILIFFAFGMLLSLPYPYRPGGEIQLLPPTQQPIQIQVDGKITKVFFEGGDGQWIKSGTVVAQMEAVDIENDVETTKEAIKRQQAEEAMQQAKLDKLLTTPRPEDVEVARQKVGVAKQQIEVAKQQVEVTKGQLQTAINKAEFSSREAKRFKQLYEQGAYSLQKYEDAAKQTEIDSNDAVEKQQSVLQAQQDVKVKQQSLAEAQANLALVLSGSHPQDIEAARKDVEAARAELKRLQQQLKFSQEQVQRTQLVMPIDGRLSTPYLNQKVGSYLEKGDTFAVAEDDRHIRAEVQVPESDTGDLSLGAKVEIKLLSYPDRPITGKVIAIQPTASPESVVPAIQSTSIPSTSTRVVKVIVDISNTEEVLKAGMTGYAKIQGRTMPAVVAFTRPIVRFVKVEVWSWLP